MCVFKVEICITLLWKVSHRQALRNGRNSYFGNAIHQDAPSDTSEKRLVVCFKQCLPLRRTGRMHRHLRYRLSRMGKRFSQERQGRVHFSPLASCVTLGRLLKLSEPQLSHLQNGNNNTYPHWGDEDSDEMI